MNKVKFTDFNISDELKQALAEIGFEYATPIQEKSLPLILGGEDVLGHSPTGSGKTAAFGLPALDMIDTELSRKLVQVLVLCPTRELALQACTELKKFAKYKKDVKIVPIYGGENIDKQIASLRQGCQIVVGTPGRVMDHMRRRTIKTEAVKMIILDEADEMLNMGFREDIETILQDMPEERQTILFSATMPAAILEITKQFQKDPKTVNIARQETAKPAIDQYYYDVPKGRKFDALCTLLDFYNPSLSIVFCNTKRMVDELVDQLGERGFQALGLHGDMKQNFRTQVMNKFRNGKTRILVATDVAARGIDVNDMEAVFNYDLPQDAEYYVHRIGRTGRAGKMGTSYTLIQGKRQYMLLNNIIHTTGSKVQRKNLPTVNEVLELKMNQLSTEVIDCLQTKDLSKCRPIIENIVAQGYSELDVAAALLAMFYITPEGEGFTEAENKDYALDERKSKSGKKDNKKSDAKFVEGKKAGKHEKFDKHDKYASKKEGKKDNKKDGKKGKVPMATLRMSIGREDKVSVHHIIDGIEKYSGIPTSTIGSISIKNDYTTIEVPKDLKFVVIDGVNNRKINGKKVTIG